MPVNIVLSIDFSKQQTNKQTKQQNDTGKKKTNKNKDFLTTDVATDGLGTAVGAVSFAATGIGWGRGWVKVD